MQLYEAQIKDGDCNEKGTQIQSIGLHFIDCYTGDEYFALYIRRAK
jgi:hypothetical protein